jgi:hypothetical protein
VNPAALKTAVLAEMLILYGLNLGKAVHADFVVSNPLPNQITERVVLTAVSRHALQGAIAVGGLAAVLLLMVDLGAGGLAAMVGLLIALGFLVTDGADALKAALEVQERILAK